MGSKPHTGHMTSHLHAHVSTAVRDCDGPLYRDYITTLTDDEQAMHVQANGVNDFHDLVFKSRVLSDHVSFCSEYGVTVRMDCDGFSVSESTEEGSRSAEVRWCEDDDCDTDTYTQRDVFAEQMNY